MNFWTIGTENASIERLWMALEEAKITVLEDIRTSTSTKKPGFSDPSMMQRAERSNMKYERTLLAPPPLIWRHAAGDARYLNNLYKSHLKDISPYIALLTERANQGERICFIGSRRSPTSCHRFVLSEELKEWGFSPIHLDGCQLTSKEG